MAEPVIFNYVRFLNAARQEAYDARKPLEREWDKGWGLYHNAYDFTKKANWQSKIVVPKYPLAVETAASILQRALIEAGDWFTVLGESELDRQKAPLIKKLQRVHLDIARFQQRLADGLRVGFIGPPIVFKVHWPEWIDEEVVFDEAEVPVGPDPSSGTHKVRMPQIVTKRRSSLRVELWDAYSFLIDPSGRNRYVIAETSMDLDQLREGAIEDIYDLEAVAQIQAERTGERQDEERRQRERQGMRDSTVPLWRRPVKIAEYWGDIVDDEGRAIMRDATFVVAEGKYLIRAPRKNPFWFRVVERHFPNVKGPFVWSSVYRVPLSPYGKGYARDASPIADSLTEQMNQMLDAALFASIDTFEINPDVLADPAQAKGGVYSGKTWIRQSGSDPNIPVVMPRILGRLDTNLLAIYHATDRLFQNATAATEFVAAVMPTRQTPTLGEYQGRQTQALGLFDIVARNIEDSLLEPLLEMVYWAILQFAGDFTQAEVMEALGDDALALAALPEEIRFEMLRANVRFRARGMSTLLQKSEDIQKIGAFLGTIGGLARQVPPIAQAVNWIGLLRRAADALNWPETEVLNLQSPEQTEMQAMQQPGPVVDQLLPQVLAARPELQDLLSSQSLVEGGEVGAVPQPGPA